MKELSKLRKKGHQVSISTAKLPAAPEALEMIYQDFLSPVLESMPAGKKMRAAIGSDSVMILLYDNLTQLAKVFEKYAEESADAEEVFSERLSEYSGELPIIPDGSMNVAQFSTFANDAGFLDGLALKDMRRLSSHGRKHSIMGSRSSSSIKQKDVRQIFSASQHDSIEANESEQKKLDDDDNLSSDQVCLLGGALPVFRQSLY